jgi:cysteinyl-tRNA synthetase
MQIQVYDTLSRGLKTFDSADYQSDSIQVYVCGPTVYNLIHIGNARAFTLFDVFIRLLRSAQFKVNYVRNITDVDDKIIQAALTQKSPTETLADKYTHEFHQDVDALGLIRPDVTPRVTEHMPDIITAVNQLLDKKAAYVLPDGVYFDVSTFKSYGALSKKKQEDLIQGTRVDLTDKKKNPGDFALWKFSKPGEPSWDTAFGAGRPGWHLECSVMSVKYAEAGLDIHGGGIDLIHPHHENEIAQSESLDATHPFSKAWMHSGFLNIGKEKMSKSMGNFIVLRQLLTYFHPEVLRLFLLSGHYRSPLEFSLPKLIELHHTLWRFYIQKRELGQTLKELKKGTSVEKNPIFKPLAQDFNTAKAIGLMFEIFKRNLKASKQGKPPNPKELGYFFQAADVLGVFTSDSDMFFKTTEALMLNHTKLSKVDIEAKIKERQTARTQKDYVTSDAIRDDLLKHNVSTQDLEDGKVSWCVSPKLD